MNSNIMEMKAKISFHIALQPLILLIKFAHFNTSKWLSTN